MDDGKVSYFSEFRVNVLTFAATLTHYFFSGRPYKLILDRINKVHVYGVNKR